MFDDGSSSEQFHQFIASSTTSLPFHGGPSFDPYAPPPLSSSAAAAKMERRDDEWSNDELLSLLKLRSTMEIWFPDFTWEHVSRKLGELGFKRSAEQCKQKFEQETTNFSSSTRILSDLDHLYHNNQELSMEKRPITAQQQQQQQDEDQDEEGEEKEREEKKKSELIEESPSDQDKKKKRKRKRLRDEKYLERLKGLCEGVVKKMMANQENLHNQLIHQLIKRDQDKMEREEARKIQEMERFKAHFDNRANDHKSAADRQALIVDFLNRFADNQQQQQQQPKRELENLNNNNHVQNPAAASNSSSSIPPSTSSNNNNNNKIISCAEAPNKKRRQNPPPPPSSPRSNDDVGRRWPRDEVVALINLRCRMSGEQETSKEKGPLWERISQGMKEMGYKRSGKRCKEKWENINKYFRKTKDSNKKRSLNSRTCPYFHYLTSLYAAAPASAPAAAADDSGGEIGDDGGAIVDVN